MPALVSLKLTNRLACQGTQAVYGVLRADELDSASDVQAVEDQESLTFRYARLDTTGTVRAITAQMLAGRVITPVWDDGSFDEWRVAAVTRGRGEKGLITVECVPLWLDLVERSDNTGKGWVSDLSAGIRNFDYEITESSASSILSTYVIPACPTYVTLGTVDPTYVIPSLSVSRLTPGAMALLVRDTLRTVDVSCELRLRRNGTTDYKLDLVTQVGSSAATPIFHPGNSLVTLREKSDPTLQATRALIKGGSAPDGLPGIWGRSRWKVSAVVGTVVTLVDRNGGSSPIAFDNQLVGTYLLRVKTGRTFAITASSATAGSVTCAAGVSTLAADEDVEFRLTEPLTNTRTTTTRYAVSAVPDGTHITCGVSAPITANNQYTDWYAKVWSAAVAGTVIATTRISASVAATDIITVASSAGVNNTHYVEFVQLDGAGEVPCYVDHPTYVQADPVGYGVKVMELSRNALGVTQLGPNGWMRTWTNGANPPDGFSTAGAGTYSRNSSVSFTRYGGFSWKCISSAGVGELLKSPPFYVTDDHGSVAARCLVYYATFAGPATGTFSIFPLQADGTLGSAWSHSVAIDSLDTVGGLNTLVDVGTWIELKIEGVPIDADAAPYGMSVVFQPSTGGGNVCYVDTMEAYGFSTCPNDPYEFGDATALAQAGNNELRLTASPPLYYTFGVLDLERAFPSEYPRHALSLGGNVRAADVEYGIDATVRLLRRDRDLLRPDATTLTLANRPTLVTNLITAGGMQQQKVINAVNAGIAASPGPAFVAFSTDTTLTIGAEVATPSGGTSTVTLPTPDPTVSDETGASIAYVPPDPTTAPTTVITVGRPPSRRKPIPIY